MNLLSPLTNCRPCRKGIPKVLAWLVMGFGLFVMILGYVVKDDIPATAQSLDGAPPAVEAQPTPVAQPAPEAAPAAPTAENAAPEAAPAIEAQPAAAPEPAPQAAQTAPAAIDASDTLAQKYNVAEASSLSGHQALIEKKKAEDNTSIFSRIMSIVGLFAFVGIAWLMSSKKKRVLWRLVAVGMGIQLVFAIFILWTPVGRAIFGWLNDAFTVLINFTNAGTTFLFASFATGAIESPLVNTAMSILPPIIFFSSLMTVLYYLGVMQWIVRGMAVFMMKFMGTSGSESLSSVANIFVGMTEAPLVVKPFVEKMTESELFAIMTGGMATVAGGTMAAYVAMLQPFFPDIAGHLIAASVMSAPASLVVAKIMMPETEKSETMGSAKFELPKTDANVIDAAARGAGEGLHLALNVAAMLLAFVAIIALINYILGLPSRLVNANTYEHVAGYVVSSGGKLDPACDSIYSTSDTISCTHGALLQLAEIRGIKVDDSLKALVGEQSDKIETTEKLYDAVLANVAGTSPNAQAVALTDCRDSHNIAACGALLAQTQSETWTPTLEKKTVWPLLSLETIFGWIFFPFAFLMGVPLSDCFLVGQLIGEKTAVNEFVAYLHLARVVDQLSYRAIVISTYALCGFANFGSIAIQIGGIGGMAPKRRSDIARLGIKAMIAGTIAAFMTATIAGALI
ncbi:MAG: hypothetical protein IJU23_14805 [Proteobacteria bacterium]|nr:hypothetical protein [Pseudomonadota bacterium]